MSFGAALLVGFLVLCAAVVLAVFGIGRLIDRWWGEHEA